MEIHNVTLREIRNEDYAQRYDFPFVEGMPNIFEPPCNSLWLTGWNRAQNVEVGDKGRLIFESGNRGTLKYSLWFFYKTDNNSIQTNSNTPKG